MLFLSKSDFIAARLCPSKLYYKKLHYPSVVDDDPYLQFLADGAYMVEHMAKLLFPAGKTLGYYDEPQIAFAELKRELQSGDGTFFQATVVHDNLLARIDILQKSATNLTVIEVKSGSYGSRDDVPSPFRGKRGDILSGYRDYLEDLTFQCVVLHRAFPNLNIIPKLCLVDKSKVATDNSTFDKFQLRSSTDSNGRKSTHVEFLGDIDRLRDEHVLVVLDATEEIAELQMEVAFAADKLAQTLLPDPIEPIASVIGQKCKKCEYRVPIETGQPNGFRECWGALSDPNPHLLDLYRVDLLGGRKTDVVSELAASGQAHLNDVTVARLQGVVAVRQRIQLEYTTRNEEWVSESLGEILAKHPYPLFFIDFEASRLAIPYHVGMHPYEIAAFQWSVHTINLGSSEIDHAEWLNTDDAFPNFEFARQLRNQIGEHGTVYIWSPYEVVVLREIRRQLEQYNVRDPDLAAWLDEITAPKNPRVVDLFKLAKDHYFHPAMKNSLSIKDVLRAAWSQNEKLRQVQPFSKYLKYDGNEISSPYSALPPLPIGDREEVVKEGTGAMRVYQEMMFGLTKSDGATRQSYRKLLLQYCELDTAAMVFIWMHWLTSLPN